jgi:hypothetical protein
MYREFSGAAAGAGHDAGGYPHKTAELGPRLQWRVGRNGRRFRTLAACFFFFEWRKYIAKMRNRKDLKNGKNK